MRKYSDKNLKQNNLRENVKKSSWLREIGMFFVSFPVCCVPSNFQSNTSNQREQHRAGALPCLAHYGELRQ
jgi:hypothetical protein